MSIDLIKRATERLAKVGQAAPVQQVHKPVMPPMPTPPVSMQAAPVQAEAIAGGQSSSSATSRSSKFVKLDMDRLRRLGVITTNTPETTQIAEEFRIIKRPLLLRAFGESGGYGQKNNHLIMVTSARPGEVSLEVRCFRPVAMYRRR